MTRRTKADWRMLIAEQQESGLTAAEYCRQHAVNPKYFSLRKKQLGASDNAFVQVTPTVSVPTDSPVGGIRLRVIEVDLPLQQSSQSSTLPLLLDRLLR